MYKQTLDDMVLKFSRTKTAYILNGNTMIQNSNYKVLKEEKCPKALYMIKVVANTKWGANKHFSTFMYGSLRYSMYNERKIINF
jgi:hypothetical protein